MELRGRHRPGEFRANQEVANVGVGLEQHCRREEHVVDADDSLLVQLDVVEKRRAAVQREVQRVVKVMIEVRASADHEIDQPAIHELDDASAKSRRRQRTGDGQADRGVVVRREHFVAENVAGLRQASRVECLEAAID
jgi:hypothetical protein